jgi:hypothetical protein
MIQRFKIQNSLRAIHLINWTKIVIFDMLGQFCGDLFFMLQNYNDCQEKAVD